MLAIALASLFMSQPASTQQLPVPTPRQLAWHQLETYAFVHFGPNTFTGKEWGHGDEKPEEFNPTELDCEQWVRVFKDAGMKGVIITAKHHDGFCLFPSKYSTHTVAQSKWKNGKGDVLAELSKACKKYGLKFGVYLSPWDRNHPSYGTPEYNDIYVKTLEEVLTGYGELFEVWFDGANGEGPNGKKQVYDWPAFHNVVRKFQPKAVMFSDAGPDIRWVGNEQGIAGDPLWATVNNSRYYPGTPLSKELTNGDPDGVDWVPAECDVSIRPGWFWRESENSKVKSGKQIFDLYLKSVGRGANFLLNVPPDTRGLIHEADIQALKEYKRLKDAFYAKPITGKWSAKDSTFSFSGLKRVGGIVIKEDIRQGQRVRQYTVEVLRADNQWESIAQLQSIGAQRILDVDIEAKAVRVRVQSAIGEPKLLPVKVYEQ